MRVSPRHWEENAGYSDLMVRRARGEEPEMDSARMIREILATEAPKGARILDIGSSAGHYLRSLRRNDPNVGYVGLDTVHPYLAAGSRIFAREGGRIPGFALGDAERLPFRDRSFDVSFSCHVLFHMPDPGPMLREAGRVTKNLMLHRTLVSERRYRIEQILSPPGDDSHRIHENIYRLEDLAIAAGAEWETSIIPTEFKVRLEKPGYSTNTVGDLQVCGDIVYRWEVVAFRRRAGA